MLPAQTPTEINLAFVLPDSFSLALTTLVPSYDQIYFNATQCDKCFWFKLNGRALANRRNSVSCHCFGTKHALCWSKQTKEATRLRADQMESLLMVHAVLLRLECVFLSRLV